MSLELLLMSESSLEENCRLADDVTAVENKKSERCGIDGGGVSLLKNWKALALIPGNGWARVKLSISGSVAVPQH